MQNEVAPVLRFQVCLPLAGSLDDDVAHVTLRDAQDADAKRDVALEQPRIVD